MPFGLRNAAQTFQRFMDQALRGLPFCFVYLDDLLVASPNLDSHMDHLRQILERLAEHGIVIHPEKVSMLFLHSIFLGTMSMLMVLHRLLARFPLFNPLINLVPLVLYVGS